MEETFLRAVLLSAACPLRADDRPASEANIHEGQITTVCGKVTYFCLTILVAKRIRRSAPASAIHPRSANQRAQRINAMAVSRLRLRPARAKSRVVRPSKLRNTRRRMFFLFGRHTVHLSKGSLKNKARLPTEPTIFTKDEAIALLWAIAANSPECTRGELTVQIRACQMMYCTLGYKPALQRLSEIATIDAVRTKGHRRAQEMATELLKFHVSSIKVDKKQRIQ